MMACGDADLPFRIELWDDADKRVEQLIGLIGDYAADTSAYEEAIKRPSRQTHYASSKSESD
jgi:hypothetical protein